ncbi:hypothetical protein, partial [Falsiroseomonas oryziterrae]|uniref:hypothetical protein n=1 Tax=Falsiroseomonas oryziterrae TaxID=2911368 RepID=UPI001F354E5D
MRRALLLLCLAFAAPAAAPAAAQGPAAAPAPGAAPGGAQGAEPVRIVNRTGADARALQGVG